MPNLSQSLQGQDLGHLHIIAELWGVELKAPDFRQGKKNLAALLVDAELASEIIESLPQEAQVALGELQANQNRIRWSHFTRKYGELRPMGPAKRDREKPHHQPSSTTEMLWYRGMIAQAFFDSQSGPQEFAYIPEDLADVLPNLKTAEGTPLSRPATPAERKYIDPAADEILDEATTLLAALRMEKDLESLNEELSIPPKTLEALLRAAKLIDKKGQPDIDNTRAFLEAPRAEAQLLLFRAWRDSSDFNDLHHIPHLECEGGWKNDPLKTRQAVMEILTSLDAETWWGLPALLASVQMRQPDFQRTAGEYDSWYIKDTRTNEYVRGVDHWQDVEGALLTFLLTGPLHWLGIVDLGMPEKNDPPVVFHLSELSQALLRDEAPSPFEENEPIQADSKLVIQVPRLAPRSLRYQMARFCQWEGKKKGNFVYRITPGSLEQAKRQGLEIKHLTALLKKHTTTPLPPNLLQSLERWDKQGTQAQLETMLVLRVKNPEILQALRESRAKRFLGDPLGPTTIMVQPGAWQQVMDALGEMGYLVENYIE